MHKTKGLMVFKGEASPPAVIPHGGLSLNVASLTSIHDVHALCDHHLLSGWTCDLLLINRKSNVDRMWIIMCI